MDKLSKAGVMAGTAKCRQVFKTPEANATSDMQMMYGNMRRVIQTAASKSAAREVSAKPLAMAITTSGAPKTPSKVTRHSTINKLRATRSSNCLMISGSC